MSDLVWYAAYGSNLLRARLLAYLTGGPVPHRPDGGHQEGGRDPTPPRADHRVELGRRLFFAGRSATWGGGAVAFLDPEPPAATPRPQAVAPEPTAVTPGLAPVGTCLGRLWLVTTDQLVDIARQENGLGEPPHIDLDQAIGAGHVDLDRGWYRRVVHLGCGPDDLPVLTVTCDRADQLPVGPAHPSYLWVVGAGLHETWGLGPGAAARYLAGSAGNDGAIDVADLATDLARL